MDICHSDNIHLAAYLGLSVKGVEELLDCNLLGYFDHPLRVRRDEVGVLLRQSVPPCGDVLLLVHLHDLHHSLVHPRTNEQSVPRADSEEQTADKEHLKGLKLQRLVPLSEL